MKKALLLLICVLTFSWAINDGDVLSVGVGTSRVIPLDYIVKSVAIGNPDLLDVVVLGKQEILLNAKKTGITSLSIWENNKVYNYKIAITKDSSSITLHKYKLKNVDLTNTTPESPDKPGKLKSIVLKDTVESIEKILANILDATQVQVLPWENSVLVVGTADEHRSAALAIASIDVIEPLTLYEIEIYEVIKDNGLVTKLNLKSGKDESLDGEATYASNSLVSDGTSATDTSTLFTLNSNTYTASGKIAAYATQALKILQTEGKAKLLATPKVLCLNNKVAILGNTERYPIVSTDKDGAVTVEYLETGVILTLISQASYDSDYINCWLNTDVSSITSFTTQGYPRSMGRGILTSTRIKNKDTLILGGLLKDTESTSITKVPILGDLLGWIPVVGAFFKNESTQKNQTELIISLKPTLIRER